MLPPDTVPFISCEDEQAPVFGLFNFYATLSSFPLLWVPLSSLKTAVYLTDVRNRAPFLHKALITWLLILTVLFTTNLFQHMVGGHHTILLHELMASVQGVWHSCLVNALRRKNGWRSLPEHSGLHAAAAVTVALAMIAFFVPRTEAYDAANGIVQGLTGIFVVGSHGALSWRDVPARKLFARSCIGLVLVMGLTGPHGLERQVCHLRAAISYHAIVDHGCVVCLFGGVAKNAVHLVNLTVRKHQDETKSS
mmetsp:Transcript_12357/g.14548  ORF Transcript_12357/g.14548 Transcript_12357/m.14548 type:complete len:251 (+) Transcript_12357:63-815(+)